MFLADMNPVSLQLSLGVQIFDCLRVDSPLLFLSSQTTPQQPLLFAQPRSPIPPGDGGLMEFRDRWKDRLDTAGAGSQQGRPGEGTLSSLQSITGEIDALSRYGT